MATTATTLVPGSFHAGESHIRSLLRVPSGPDPRQGNPTSIGLPRAYAYRASISPVIAVGALDAQLRPWATLWGGDRADAEAGGAGGGACAPVGQDVLGIRGTVDCAHDPVVGALFGGRVGKGEVVRADDGAEYAGEEKEEEKEEEEEEEATKGIGRGRRKNLMAALTIDFESRDRVKLAGKFVAGAVFGADEDEVGKGKDDEVARDDESESESKKKKAGALRLAFAVRESLGNCPKYLNKKDVRPVTPEPELVVENEGKDEGVLGPKALELIRRADMFFVSSCDGGECMDVNHRGGQEGFVRVLETGTRTGTGTGTGTGKGERESEGEGGKSVLVWPEYSGNRLYQTLGNFHLKPLAGMVIPDYNTGNVLYLTGTSQILHSATATALLPHSKLAVKLTVSSSRFVRRGLPFRAVPGEPSPYNPPAWPLSCERSTLSSSFPPSITSQFTASLTRRDILSPTIARFAFLVSSPSSSSVCGNRDEGKEEGKKLQWQPGQHISLNFAPELDIGYAHVRDDDPGSLNDDFVRTFTISSPPAPRRSPEDGDNASKIPSVVELEITARLHGPATALLFKHPVGRVPLDIPVLGVGGEERLRVTSSANPEDDDPNRGSGAKSVFIASGVGVTPLLAQAPSLLEKGLSVEFEVFWTIRKEDLGLVKDSVERIKGLGERVRLFVTGVTAAGDSEGGLDSSSNLVRSLKTRRMRREDVLGDGMAGKRKYFCCTGPALKKELDGWLDGEDVAWEDFGY